MKASLFLAASVLVSVVQAAPPGVQFSTLLGGASIDIPFAVAVDSQGYSYVAAFTVTQGLPNGTQFGFGVLAWIAKVRPDGSGLEYAVNLGGLLPRAIAVDNAGQVYVAGYSFSQGLATENAFQATQPGRPDGHDAVLLKLNAAGNDILFATYLGGAEDDGALALALDGEDVWITGLTSSVDFPIRNAPEGNARSGEYDAFLARFSSTGELEFSRYFGGAEGRTIAAAMTVDSQRRPIIVGRTGSPTFPLLNPIQAASGGVSDAFVTRFDATGWNLDFSTYLGGSSQDSATGVAVDATGNIYVHGSTRSPNFPPASNRLGEYAGDTDVFVTKLSPDGSAFLYSRLLGGFTDDSYRSWPLGFGSVETILLETGGMAVDQAGRVMVVGATYADNFPMVDAIDATNLPYSNDAFITLLEADGTIRYSTYLGGSGGDWAGGAAAVPNGGFAVVGRVGPAVFQPEFPVTSGSERQRMAGVDGDGFLIVINETVGLPVNNAFANATVIRELPSALFVDTRLATSEPGEAILSGGEKSAWYRYTATETGALKLHAEGAGFHVSVGVFEGETVGSLVERDSAAAATCATRLRIQMVAGQSLSIRVAGTDGASGPISISSEFSLQPHDDFTSAFPLPPGPFSIESSNVGSTGEWLDPFGRSVWWRWTPEQTGSFTLTTAGSNFDTMLSIFRAAEINLGNPEFTSWDYIDSASRLTWRAEAGVEYAIRVEGQNRETGTIRLTLTAANRPPNDDFAGRITLTGRNHDVRASDVDAIFDPLEVALLRDASINAEEGHVLWWEWVAPETGAAIIAASGTTSLRNGSTATTRLVIGRGTEFPLANAVQGVSGLNNTPVYIADVREGDRFTIGVGTIWWESPVELGFTIRLLAPPRIFANTIRIEAGRWRGRVEGVTGNSYRLMATENFRDWEEVSRHMNIVNDFEFDVAATPNNRFFRVEEIPAP